MFYLKNLFFTLFAEKMKKFMSPERIEKLESDATYSLGKHIPQLEKVLTVSITAL